MEQIKEILKLFKPLVYVAIVVVLIVCGTKIFTLVSAIFENKNAKLPITKIEAQNNESYAYDDEYKLKDFIVTATHNNNKKTTLKKDQYVLNKEKPDPYGKYTVVTVSLKKDESINCKVKVKNERNETIAWYVGTPVEQDVIARLYDNGELHFEGKGDIQIFNEFPWQDSEEYYVQSITFGKDVKPTNLSNFFQNMENLKYVQKIPTSVQNMRYTFQGCTSLSTAPDWSDCMELIDISGAYSDCTALSSADSIPVNTRVADEAFMNCTSLLNSPDMSSGTCLQSAKSMYANCTVLANFPSFPPNLLYADSMFVGCINLKEVPNLPENIVSINNMFEGCTTLTTCSYVPYSVTTMNSAFLNCTLLDGTMKFNANPTEFDAAFEGASIATQTNLVGESSLLNDVALTGNANILVNGAPAMGRSESTLIIKKKSSSDATSTTEETIEETTEDEVKDTKKTKSSKKASKKTSKKTSKKNKKKSKKK